MKLQSDVDEVYCSNISATTVSQLITNNTNCFMENVYFGILLYT